MFVLFLCVGLAVPRALAAPKTQVDFYTVQEDDTWGEIALRYGISPDALWKANGVINPDRLDSGERLYIPDRGNTLEEPPLTFEVKGSQAIRRAAVYSGNGLVSLLLLNGIRTSAEAFGQTLYAPDRRVAISLAADNSQPTDEQPPTPEPASTEQASNPTEPEDIPEGALLRSQIGVQGHFLIADQRERLLDRAAYNLEVGWVKQQVPWDEIEYAPDQYSDVMLEALDAFVDDAFNRQVYIMLSIVKAPDWARSTTDEDGPPVN